jgi:MFS family permease
MFSATAVVAPALPSDLGLDESGLGVFGALTFAGAMFGTSVAAFLMPRHGPIRLIQVGVLLSGLALAALFTGLGWLVFAAAVFIGIGYGPNAPGGSYLLSRHTHPARRSLIFSIKQSGVPAGGALVGVVVPLVEARQGWEAALLAVILIGVVAVIVMQPWRARLDLDVIAAAPARVAMRLSDVIPVAAVRGNPVLVRIALMSFTYGAGQMILGTFLVIFLVEKAAMTLVSAGVAFSAMQVSSFLVRMIAGWLNDRLGQSRPILASFGVVTAISVTLLAMVDAQTPYGLVLLLAVSCGAGAAGWNGVYLAEVARQVPEQQIASATAATVFFTYFGLVVGPAAFSLLLALDGYGLAFAGLAALVLTGGLIILVPPRGVSEA